MRGIVASGVGGGKKYDESIKPKVEEKIGFKPYPGTMNVKISKESMHKRQQVFGDAGNDRPKVARTQANLSRH